MTEPPEPRRPEEGGGDEDFLEELDDDVLLDALGSGEGPDDGELADMLGAWRDDVESVPPSPGTAPETVQQIHDFTQEIDRVTAPPRVPQERNTTPMSISDAVNGMNQIAGDTSAAGPLYDAKNGLEISTTNALQQSVTAISQLNSMGLGALEGAPEAAGEFGAAAERAATQIEEAIDATQAALAAVAAALEAEQMFRVKAQHIADRLSAL